MNRKILFIFVFLLSFVMLVACNNETEKEDKPQIDVTSTLEVEVSETKAINAKVTNTEKTYELVYKSSDDKVATVNNKGEVTGIKEGTAKITVSLKEKSTVKATVNVTVIDNTPILTLTGPDTVLIGETIQMTATDRTSSDNVVWWESSNPLIFTVDTNGKVTGVSAGKATLTIYSNQVDEKLSKEITVLVPEIKSVELDPIPYDVITLNTKFRLIAKVLPYGVSQEVTWSSSDEDVAIVNEVGQVTPVGAGEVTITVTAKDTNISAHVTFEVTPTPMEIFEIAHRENPVIAYDVMFWGNDDPKLNSRYDVYGSVSNYLFTDLVIDTKSYVLPSNRENYSNQVMTSVEYIVFHDTASASGGAAANAGWCVNPSNTGTSWHFTVGNDGIFQSLPLNIAGWHAGDGMRPFKLFDTGVKVTTKIPVLEIYKQGSGGYWKVNGIETNVSAPLKSDGSIPRIVDVGIYTEIGPNNTYLIGDTYYNSTYQLVSNTGGGANGIGIESAMNNGSDLYLTWQLGAKLVASLMEQLNLGIERVKPHHAFSGKDCPRTMRNAGLWYNFLELVKAEDLVNTYLKDYTIEFISNNPEFVDARGRIMKLPDVETKVSYVVKITNKTTGKIEQKLFTSTLPAKRK